MTVNTCEGKETNECVSFFSIDRVPPVAPLNVRSSFAGPINLELEPQTLRLFPGRAADDLSSRMLTAESMEHPMPAGV